MFTKDVIVGIMAALYVSEQRSLNDVSKMFGCCTMTVKNWLVKNGHKIRPKGRVPGKKNVKQCTRRRT